jgi:hypothetical protein
METWLKVMLGVGVLAISFWITLLATEAPPPSDLDIAAADEGLSKSDAVSGSVDSIERDRAGRLRLIGWAFDKELAQPVSIRVLNGVKFEQIAVTNGARTDVTQALKETAERTKNVTFTGLTQKAADCGPFTIVGVNQKKHLSILASDLMVPRCSF